MRLPASHPERRGAHCSAVALAGLPSTTYGIHEPKYVVRGLETCIAPLVRWSWMACSAEAIGRTVTRRRARARCLPHGRVFIGIPHDLLEADREVARPELFSPIPWPMASTPVE